MLKNSLFTIAALTLISLTMASSPSSAQMMSPTTYSPTSPVTYTPSPSPVTYDPSPISTPVMDDEPVDADGNYIGTDILGYIMNDDMVYYDMMAMGDAAKAKPKKCTKWELKKCKKVKGTWNCNCQLTVTDPNTKPPTVTTEDNAITCKALKPDTNVDTCAGQCKVQCSTY